LRHAQLANLNYKIDFGTAMKENLLGVLAGDFSYRLVPGTRIRMRMRKMTEPDQETGAFKVQIIETGYVNPNGQVMPNIPHLSSRSCFGKTKSKLSMKATATSFTVLLFKTFRLLSSPAERLVRSSMLLHD
jgi:hypothetical protein